MIQPRLVWELARKDLLLFLADRRSAVLCFAVPVVLAIAFVYLVARSPLDAGAAASGLLPGFSNTNSVLLACERLGPFAAKVEFVIRDFRSAEWSDGLGRFDAVVTMQAAHEIRHKRHLPKLLTQIRAVMVPDGILLYCDHYAEGGENSDLMLNRDDQPLVLERAGFTDVRLLLDKGGMALYAAKPG